MPKKEKKTKTEIITDHIRLIVTLNKKATAISLIYQNGYARTLEEAEKIWIKEAMGR